MASDPASRRPSFRPAWLLGAGAALFLIAAALRDQHLYAALFADEWHYSAYSRLGPISEAKLPSYLYLWIFRLTSQCGTQFLDCARFFNSLLLAAALPLVYRVLRRFAQPLPAALLALLSLAAPVNSFAAYFIPESMYYLLFWALALAVLRPYQQRPLAYGIAAGAIMGLMCLVKMHAVFVAIGFAVFVVADTAWPPRRERIGPALIVLASSAAVFVAVRFGLGYLLGGPPSLSWFGAYYQGQAQGNIGVQPLPALIANLFYSARGHVLALSLLFGPLLVPALLQLFCGERDEATARARSAVLFALAMLGSIVSVAVYFTASMATMENVGRLHLRYYDFCFPLLLLAPLIWRGLRPTQQWRRRLAWTLALAVAATTLYAGLTGLSGYFPQSADTPELVWTVNRHWLAIPVGIVGAIACLAWVAAKDLRLPRLAAFGYYALVIALGSGAVTVAVRKAKQPDVYVHAGEWLRDRHPELISQTQLLGRDSIGLLKARFYADSQAIVLRQVDPGRSAADAADWGRDTAIVFGDLSLPEGRYARKQALDGFTLYWLKPADTAEQPRAGIETPAPH